MSLLISVASNPDMTEELIKMLLDNGADVNHSVDEGSPLMFAVLKGKLETSKLLVKKGANINYVDNSEGFSCLLLAVCEEYPKICSFLLENGAEVNYVRSVDGATPLIWAAKFGRGDICSILLKYGANVNSVYHLNGGTALNFAVLYGHGEVASMLMWHGADVNYVNEKSGGTPLILAVVKNQFDIATNLLHHGADVNKMMKGSTPLPHAVCCRWVDARMCEILLQFGADPNESFTFKDDILAVPEYLLSRLMKDMMPFTENKRLAEIDSIDSMFLTDENEGTLLQIASMIGDKEKCRILIKYGADKDVSSTYGLTPLMTAAKEGSIGTESIVQLLQEGVDINKKDVKGMTALYTAVQQGCLENVKILLENGADPNIESRKGFTPLHDAAYGGDQDIVKILIQHGANVNSLIYAEYSSTTALHNACMEGNLEVAQVLVEHGAMVECYDGTGAAPLHLAAQYNRPSVIRFLVKEAGCNPDIVSNSYNFQFIHTYMLASVVERENNWLDIRGENSSNAGSNAWSQRIHLLST